MWPPDRRRHPESWAESGGPQQPGGSGIGEEKDWTGEQWLFGAGWVCATAGDPEISEIWGLQGQRDM